MRQALVRTSPPTKGWPEHIEQKLVRKSCMAKISPIDTSRFERWVLEYYADEFLEWELEASEWIELDEFIWRNYPEIIYEWQEERI